jgi:site-specific DNA recombinase
LRGHELVKEYIDDGYSGTLLDRPGLGQLRADAKSDVYDAMHFLDAQIIIKGKDYVDLPDRRVPLRKARVALFRFGSG